MADRIRIGYFLEDRGHETFLKALVNRLAVEKGLKTGEWANDVRSASGGKSIEAYRGFLKDITRPRATNPFNILIVASDGNCKGYQEKRNQLLKFAEKVKLSRTDTLVLAIPDPHIERWYMSDPQAFNRAFGSGVLPVLPAYKCEKSHYKKIMQDAIAPPMSGLCSAAMNTARELCKKWIYTKQPKQTLRLNILSTILATRSSRSG